MDIPLNQNVDIQLGESQPSDMVLADDIESPPIESPPIESPPIESPPIESPPIESPPIESPPIESPPIEIDIVIDDVVDILFKISRLSKNINKNNLKETQTEIVKLLTELLNPEYLNILVKLHGAFLTTQSGIVILLQDLTKSDNEKIEQLQNLIIQKRKSVLDLQKLNIKDLKSIVDKITTLFSLDMDYYKKNYISVPNDKLKDNLKQLFPLLPGSIDKHTYTFNISSETNQVEIVHNLFGDLFMIRSEIPHDFSEIRNKKLYQKIISLSIYEYIYKTFTDNTILTLLENILKIELNEERSGISVLELIYLSGIPLIKQSKNKLSIEVEENEHDACIFPLVFNTKQVQVVSDADSQANKYYSQIEELIPASIAQYPFLNFDAGSAPTFYNFRDFVERQEQLYSADDDDITPQIPPQIPPEIFVKSLDNNTYLKIINSQIEDQYTYNIQFMNPDSTNIKFKRIINLLNSDSENLQLYNVSISKVTSIVNIVLQNLYKVTSNIIISSKTSKKIPAQSTANSTLANLTNLFGIINNNTLTSFLEEQIYLYENYVVSISNGRYTATPVKGNKQEQDDDMSGGETISKKRKIEESKINIAVKKGKVGEQQEKLTLQTEITTNKDPVIATLICKILLNTISVKSLGDLVPYYITLIQLMNTKPQLEKTYDLNLDELTDYFTDLKKTKNEYFGVLGSADYSLIQSPLININFTDNPASLKHYRDSEMVSCVHIKDSDITLPLSKREIDIYRLMSCIEGNGCKIEQPDREISDSATPPTLVNYFFNDIIDKLTIYSSYEDFMNITKNVRKLKKLTNQIMSFKRNVTDSSSPQETIMMMITRLLRDKKPDETDLFLKNNYEELDNFKNNYTLFIQTIDLLNQRIRQINPKEFFNYLQLVSERQDDRDILDIEIKNPNIYFVCEYIIRNLSYKLSTPASEQSSIISSSGVQSSDMDITAGGKKHKIKKSKKHKNHNKTNKFTNKKTRKYVKK